MIYQVGLHPVTCLTTLTEAHIKTLLNEGNVLCIDALNNIDLLDLSPAEKEKVREEARELCLLSARKEAIFSPQSSV